MHSLITTLSHTITLSLSLHQVLVQKGLLRDTIDWEIFTISVVHGVPKIKHTKN